MDANAESRGSINVNGSIYDIIENTRTNQPSIIGTATFQQYFSIRRDKRNSGTINITDHFNQWETLGMDMGKMYEVSFVVEGYKSSGSFEFTELEVTVNNDLSHVSGKSTAPSYLSFYPNPCSGNVSVELDESVIDASLKIYDTSSRIIFSRENINNHLLQISNLTSGIYFVNVSSNSLNCNTKLIVN
jgi:endo-1,4-beta-xylanase